MRSRPHRIKNASRNLPTETGQILLHSKISIILHYPIFHNRKISGCDLIPVLRDNFCVIFDTVGTVYFDFHTLHILHPFSLLTQIRRTITFISPVFFQKFHVPFMHVPTFKYSFAKSCDRPVMNTLHTNIRLNIKKDHQLKFLIKCVVKRTHGTCHHKMFIGFDIIA